MKPTVEEILNDFHQKSFAAQSADERGTAATYSRNSNSGNTLVQETVDRLNAAGYEAYHVTASNYNTLEAELNTDFASMGLDPNGSYIVTISGEDSSNTNHTRGIGDNLITPTPDPGHGGGTTNFMYTYNGVTYHMRYVTVTPAEIGEFGLISDPIDLIDKYGADDLAASLAIPITILSSLGVLPFTGSLYSLIFSDILNADSIASTKLEYTGKTNWTVTYTQVYNFSDSTWNMRTGIEYVTMSYDIVHRYYDSSENRMVTDVVDELYGIVYSQHYNSKEYMKYRAVLAEQHNNYWLDEVTYVEYQFDGETIITHYRPFPELYP